MKEIADIQKNMSYGPAPENPKEANSWIEGHGSKLNHFIGGEWIKPNSKKYFETINPSNKKVLASIALGNPKDVDLAVENAAVGLKTWRAEGTYGRSKYLYAIARQIQKHARLFAVLESLDNGKSIRETRDIDIPLVIRHFYHHAGWAHVRDTEFPGSKEIGIVGQIIPWNFPLLMLAWKIAPAIAMGNTVILKPAEQTPLTALLFAEICEKVGLPKGVVNIVTGDGSTGEAIVNHSRIKKIAFTGSTDVGKLIRKSTAGKGKKLSLELGGKSPFIIFEDADIDSAIEGIVDAIWFNQGEVCCAGSRLLVQENVAEKVIRKLKKRMSKLRVGDPLDKSVDMGAVVSDVQVKTIKKLVKAGVKDGARLWQPDINIPAKGHFYPPTLFTEVAPSSIICQEEIFGPVLVALTFRTHKEAVALANNTRYGLAASVWTEDINLALDVAPKIKAGTVWINSTNEFDAASGFGGFRESGFGREGGREGIYEYVTTPNEMPSQGKRMVRKTTKSTSSKEVKDISIDRTAKLYIGGKQVRPDGGYTSEIMDPAGNVIGDVGIGNRKDIRNAVEAAHKASGWASKTAHQRAQVLYFMAENLGARRKEFESRLVEQLFLDKREAALEVENSIRRIFYYAGIADKYDGNVHSTTSRNVTLAMPEAIGVVGLTCPEDFPLLGFISTVLPLMAMGNRVISIPSSKNPLSATDLYQVLDTSDVPGGVVNIITGNQDELIEVLSSHYDIDAIWYFGTKEGSRKVEELSADSMKRTWVNFGRYRNWQDPLEGEGTLFTRKATQLKNIWIPYGA